MSSKKKYQQSNTDLSTIEQSLTQENPNLFQGIPENKKKAILRTVNSVSLRIQMHSGYLPSPDILNQYNTIIPDGADRIMKMAEQQSAH